MWVNNPEIMKMPSRWHDRSIQRRQPCTLLALLQHNQEGRMLLFVISALWQDQLQVIPSDQESSQWWSAESQRGEEMSPKMSQMFMQTIKIKTKQLDSFMLVSLIYFDHFSQVFFFFSLDIFFLRYWRPSRATRRTWRPRSSGGSSHSHTLW